MLTEAEFYLWSDMVIEENKIGFTLQTTVPSLIRHTTTKLQGKQYW